MKTRPHSREHKILSRLDDGDADEGALFEAVGLYGDLRAKTKHRLRAIIAGMKRAKLIDRNRLRYHLLPAGAELLDELEGRMPLNSVRTSVRIFERPAVQ